MHDLGKRISYYLRDIKQQGLFQTIFSQTGTNSKYTHCASSSKQEKSRKQEITVIMFESRNMQALWLKSPSFSRKKCFSLRANFQVLECHLCLIVYFLFQSELLNQQLPVTKTKKVSCRFKPSCFIL